MLDWYDFKEKTLIVGDRGYESYNAFAHLQNTPNRYDREDVTNET